MVFVQDGEELLDYLLCRGRYQSRSHSIDPDLILLDLNMPKKSGFEVIDELHKVPDLRRIPIVVFTSSQEESDILQSYQMGVSGYMVKPGSFAELVDLLQRLGKYWFTVVSLPSRYLE